MWIKEKKIFVEFHNFIKLGNGWLDMKQAIAILAKFTQEICASIWWIFLIHFNNLETELLLRDWGIPYIMSLDGRME